MSNSNFCYFSMLLETLEKGAKKANAKAQETMGLIYKNLKIKP